jgi:hypothetical protein
MNLVNNLSFISLRFILILYYYRHLDFQVVYSLQILCVVFDMHFSTLPYAACPTQLILHTWIMFVE